MKGGNIGKIKYFLPRRTSLDSEQQRSHSTLSSKVRLEGKENKINKNKKTNTNIKIGFDPNNKSLLEKKLMQRRNSRQKQCLEDNSRQNDQTYKESIVLTDNKHMESIDVDIVGIQDYCQEQVPEVVEKKNILDMFPEQAEKEEFFKFLEKLKDDKNFQDTITMFTVMYYYQKKK